MIASFALRHIQLFEDGQVISNAILWIEDGKIRYAGPETGSPTLRGVTVVDGKGATLAPGFIELQLNGGYGHDFTGAPQTLLEVAKRLPETGVVAFLPTFITSPLDEYAGMLREVETAKAIQQDTPGEGARILGAHVEGPFLSPAKKGAHRVDLFCDPTPPALSQIQPLSAVRLLTLAPERQMSWEAIRYLTRHGVVASIGHSAATPEDALSAIDAGASYATHLYNAMSSMGHRDPALVGTLLSEARIPCGVIADGVHVHPSMVHIAYRCLGMEKITLVTDAMAAMGMPAGEYVLGGSRVIVDGHSARLADGTLAGSILRLDEAVRNMVAFSGCSPAQAVRMATTTPAEVLGIDQETGHLRPGAQADLVVLDDNLQVQATFIAGRPAYRNEGFEFPY